jgi:hypothetical protein
MIAHSAAWRVPSGKEWDGTAQPLDSSGGTNDGGCVAIRRNPDGTVSVADSKKALADQTPLTFLPQEWADFELAIRAGSI